MDFANGERPTALCYKVGTTTAPRRALEACPGTEVSALSFPSPFLYEICSV